MRYKPLPRPKILFPNEHGAWGMFATAFLLGWLAVPALSWQPLLLLPAAIGAFLTRYPLGLYFKKRRVTRAMKISLTREKKWFWIYGLSTAIVSIPLFYPIGWWWLLIFAGLSSITLAIHLRSIKRKQERTLFSEVTAMVGISFLTPASAYAAIGVFRFDCLVIWILFILFYAQRIVVIRDVVSKNKKGKEVVDLKKVGNRELVYSVAFLALAVGIVRIFYLL